MAPRKIIIDTDPGVDDVLAILLALASPEIEVAAITITFGNTHAQSAYSNLLKIYASLAREFAHDPEAIKRYPGMSKERARKTILALGADEPVGGEKSTAAYFHGADGLSNISQTHPHFTPPELKEGEVHEYLELSKKASSEVILDVLAEEPEGSVVIVALGPLSNLALAQRKDAKTFARVGEVVWMGGALDVPGNTSPAAEFNCFADPYAAQEIIDSVRQGIFPMAMAPLDITTPHTIPFSQLIHDATLTTAPTPLKDFTSTMLIRVRGLMNSFGLDDAMEMHDPLAVWYAIENPVGRESGEWEKKKRVFMVERSGEYTRGMCVVNRRGGDESSFFRTKADISDGVAEKERDGGDKLTPKDAPSVIVRTPGKEMLEKVLLGRVFGV